MTLLSNDEVPRAKIAISREDALYFSKEDLDEIVQGMDKKDRNSAYINSHRSELRQKYPNQYIVVQDEMVLGAGDYQIREQLKEQGYDLNYSVTWFTGEGDLIL